MTARIRFGSARTWGLALLILAVSGLALWLRLHALGRESLWLDEGFSWRRARLPLPELIDDAISEHHNPSYFFFLHYWLGLGDDEFMLRLPSAIAGTLATAATAVLGCVLAGRTAGFVAGMLFALAPVHVQFGQEARMYAALSASATVSTAALLWLGMHPEASARPIWGLRRLRRWPGSARAEVDAGTRDVATPGGASDHASTWAWIAYVLGMVVSLYLHNTAALFGATAATAALALALRPFRVRLGFVINFAVANAVVLAGWAPYLGVELRQVERFSHSEFWAKFPSQPDLINSARELYLMTADWPSPLATGLLLVAALGLWALRARPEVALATLLLAALGPALFLLISLHKPIYGTRLLLWSSPAFFGLVGAGSASVAGRWVSLRWVAAVAFVAWVGWLVRPELELDYVRLRNEPWRQVVSTVRSRVLPSARILTATGEEKMMFDYYMHRSSHPLLDLPIEVAQRPGVWRQVQGAERVWLVDRKAGGRSGRARKDLSARGRVDWDRAWNRRLRVIQFDFTGHH